MRAVQIAQQVEGPVQVIWTREEDIQHDMYRPYYYDRISAGVDAQGKPVGWSHRIAGSSILARYFPAGIKNGVDPDAVESSANLALRGSATFTSSGSRRSRRESRPRGGAAWA